MSLKYFMLYNISFLSRLIFSRYIVLPGSSLPSPLCISRDGWPLFLPRIGRWGVGRDVGPKARVGEHNQESLKQVKSNINQLKSPSKTSQTSYPLSPSRLDHIKYNPTTKPFCTIGVSPPLPKMHVFQWCFICITLAPFLLLVYLEGKSMKLNDSVFWLCISKSLMYSIKRIPPSTTRRTLRDITYNFQQLQYWSIPQWLGIFSLSSLSSGNAL